MIEEGIVKSADGKIAVVTLDKKTECSRCGMCAFPKNANKIDIRAVNTAGAKAGDTVFIEKSGDGKLAGVFFAFMVPLLLIGVAVGIGYYVIGKEIWILLLSLIFVALWYTILAIIDKKLAFLNKFCAVVVEIKENDDGDENEKRNDDDGGKPVIGE